jgi:hypothetical protein
MVEFNSYRNYCEGFASGDEEVRNKAQLMLCLRDALLQTVVFDKLSGEIIPQGTVDVAGERAFFSNARNDALSHIIDGFYGDEDASGGAFRKIADNMREKIIRENVIMPVTKVREINTRGIQWLSKKPGETIKQKLSAAGLKMMAVNRRMVLDTGENRLFMQLLREFETLLTLKMMYLPPERVKYKESDFYEELTKILRNGDLSEIQRWENLSPNNTLLSDKHYRMAWRAWRSIHKLDEIVRDDSTHITRSLASIFMIKLLGSISRYCRLPQVPILIDYDTFDIKLYDNRIRLLLLNNPGRVTVNLKENRVNWKQNEIGWFCCVYGHNSRTMIYSTNFMYESEFSIELEVISFETEVNTKREGEFIAKNIRSGVVEPFYPVEISTEENGLDFITENGVTSIIFNETTVEMRHGDENPRVTRITPVNFEHIINAFSKLSLHARLDSFYKSPKIETIKGSEGVIEIYSIRPIYAVDSDKVRKFPVKLLFQQFECGGRDITTNIGNANAIILNKSIFSIRDTLENSESQNKGAGLNAELFVVNVAENLKVKELTYIIPDVIDEFQTKPIRQNINLLYSKSAAFPKSMGLLFQWQYSVGFGNARFKDGDFVLVADIVYNMLTYTLIKGSFDKRLLDAAPESLGFVWERHPTHHVQCDGYLALIEKLLKSKGCNDAELLLDILWIDGLIQERDALSVDINGQWFHITEELCCEIENNAFNINGKINDYIKTKRTLTNKGKVHVLLGTSVLKASVAFGFDSGGAVNGYREYAIREALVDFPLWSDHIPRLAIKQLYGTFELLDDVTIVPKFGKVHEIHIENIFTLPAGSALYHFPLIKGDGITESRHKATLSHIAFPLAEKAECELRMTYQYGAEDPYTLIFVPKDKKKAGFSEIKAQWEKIDNYPSSDLPYPKFPAVKSWDELQRHPNKDGSGIINFLTVITEVINKIGENKIRTVNLKNSFVHWKPDRNGRMFCRVSLDGVGEVFIHENNFVNKHEFTMDCDVIYFNVGTRSNDGGYFAQNVVLSHNPYDDPLSKQFYVSLFAFHTVFFNGRKVFDPECPAEFKETVLNGIEKLKMAFINTSVAANKIYYFDLLCLMSGNDPRCVCDIVAGYIDEYFHEKKNKYTTSAITFGNHEYTEQKMLYEKVCEDYPDRVIPMLATAMWKNERLIFEIPYSDTLEYFRKAVTFIHREAEDHKTSESIKTIGYRTINNLEFMLAVFRLRELNNPEINSELSMNKGYIKKAYEAIETLAESAIKKKMEIRSFVRLQVNKPVQYKDIPNLLYALLVYVSGNTGEEEIIISSIDNDD